MAAIEIGLDTFGCVPADDRGALVSQAAAIRQVVEEAVLADQTGLDAIALGEHHRPEFSISTPETVLAGIAGVTSRIKLGSGVTVLSSDDPVRVFQRFATVDALSTGRAQVILGRGSFTESFALFGHHLGDYDLLFEEKLGLFVQLLAEQPVTWQGRTRPPLQAADVFPKTESGHLDTRVGVGGSPESVIRAARHGLPIMLAAIAGPPARYRGYVDLYRRTAENLGAQVHPVGLHSPGFVADTDQEAKERFYPALKVYHDRIGRERGWAPLTPAHFEAEVDEGSYYIGSPETVARKIATTISQLNLQRFDMIYTAGAQSMSARTRSVELFGTRVAPMVRELLAA